MASSSFGGTVKLTGESEYKKALKEIQSSLRLVSSELKLTNTEFSNGDKTLKDVKSSYSNMNSTVQDQKSKIAELKKTVAEMSKEYGDNNEKVKLFKTQLNNAETELSQMENATDKNNKELKEMKENFDGAGQSGLKLGDIIKGNLISEGIIAGVKQLGSAMKELGSAMIDIGKSAVNSYADYEQLVGGVDTLFKESSETVQEYAKKAYMTAGISANEYMETVTSFSASLLQSLSWDTESAAKYADMAIIDMSDNANKMGTSMESIQNAYQGFAKQNYTMLDNLKLGYGGTKTEMERLITDANKLKQANGQMADLTIDSYADIVEAIHLIQTEMDITGTTQLEASETISGSINSMQSAWENMLTGLADGDSNLSELMDNLVGSVLTVADNLMPVIKQVMDSVIQILPDVLAKIIEYLPQFLDAGKNMLTTLISGITNNMQSIIDSVMQIINVLIETIIQNLPQILEMGIQILTSLVNGIAETLPELIPQMINAILLMVDTLLDNIDLIIDTGINLIMALADGLIEALPDLIDKIPIIIDKLIDAITNNLPKLIEAGITLIIKLAEGIIKAIPQLVGKVPEIISSFIGGIKNYYSKLISIGGELLGKVKEGITNGIGGMYEVGRNVVQGLWNGINSAKDWVLDKIKGFGSSILDGIKSFFGIHSPSTIFRDEVGKNLALGLGEGFSDEMVDVNREIQNSLPTDFDLSSNVNLDSSINSDNNYSQSYLVDSFKQALSEMKIELDDEVAGRFVTNTIERAIYS